MSVCIDEIKNMARSMASRPASSVASDAPTTGIVPPTVAQERQEEGTPPPPLSAPPPQPNDGSAEPALDVDSKAQKEKIDDGENDNPDHVGLKSWDEGR